MTRNYQPHSYIDLERDAAVQEMLDHFSLSIDDLGGGNSAGQAAVFLAQTTRRVYMLNSI